MFLCIRFVIFLIQSQIPLAFEGQKLFQLSHVMHIASLPFIEMPYDISPEQCMKCTRIVYLFIQKQAPFCIKIILSWTEMPNYIDSLFVYKMIVYT